MRRLFLGLVIIAACGGSSSSAPPGPSRSGDLPPGDTCAPTAAARGIPCDVDAVLAKNCRTCHSVCPEFGAPMSLMTWDDLHASAKSDPAKKVFELAGHRIDDDVEPMPPPPNARLSEVDRKKIQDWAAAGAPRSNETCSNPATPPPPPPNVSCTPNLTLAPESPWEMPANAGDEYVCWGVDLAKNPATHITAFAPRIDNTKIVHHIVLYEAPSKYSGLPTPCSAGSSLAWRMVLAWAPGAKGLELPTEAGFPISTDSAKPTHYVVQVHYSNAQRIAGEKDSSSIDLCTSPPRKYEADVMAFGSQEFTIPPGRYTLDCALKVPTAFTGLHFFAAMPHMHKLGAAMTTTLTPKAGGAPVDLGTMPSFSFDAQAWLPIRATTAAGDEIRTQCTWVNPTGAPVDFGENTANEMCYSFTMYYPRITSGAWSWAAPASGPPFGATCEGRKD